MKCYNDIMKTQMLKPTKENIEKLAKLVLSDEPVAFPTDTVYGIGANAFSDCAVEKIYNIKGRPKNKPLILLVKENFDLNSLVVEVNETAKVLIENFWPGALTLVFDLKAEISKFASAGFTTVGIRVPNDKNAQMLLNACNLPLATPSANISGNKSPVSAIETLENLDGKINAILDGGPCTKQIESTIVDVTTNTPKIIREGAIKKEEIFKFLK